MNKQALRNGFRSGNAFGVVVIFLFLVGFMSGISTILGNSLGHLIPALANHGKSPNYADLFIFVALIGIWCGWQGAKPSKNDSYLNAVVSGLSAGIVVGLWAAVIVFLTGIEVTAKVDMRVYLAEMSAPAVNFFLFGKTPLIGALYQLLLLASSGLVGGFLARFLGRGAWRKQAKEAVGQFGQSIFRISWVKSVFSNIIIRYAFFGLILVGLALLPLKWGPYWNYTVGTVGLYILLGLGLDIIVGLAGQLVLGYVAFFAVGAYSMALLNSTTPLNLHYGFWVAVVVGVVLSALAGILLGLPTLRLRGDYLAIVTLGFGEIMRIMLKSDLLTNFTGGPRGVQNINEPTIFGHPLSTDIDYMYMIILAVLLTIFIYKRLKDSRIGRSWVAIREDETVARASGINTFYSKLLALAIGAAFAGLAGVIFAARNQYTGPDDHAMMVSINVLCITIVGGMGSIPGIILGSFALKGLPEMLRELENYRMLAFGALLVVMMILRPEGLWPGHRQKLDKSASKDASAPSVLPHSNEKEAGDEHSA
jgi:ABC-type branched-subunit amino acid transport system permease subunit